MSADSALHVLPSLSRKDKALLMSLLSLELTVAARHTHGDELPAVRKVEWLQKLNEIQHRLAGQSIGYLCEAQANYPDNVMIGMLTASSGDADLDRVIGQAVARAVRMIVEIGPQPS